MNDLGHTKIRLHFNVIDNFRCALQDSHTASKVTILCDRYILMSLEIWLCEQSRLRELAENRKCELTGKKVIQSEPVEQPNERPHREQIAALARKLLEIDVPSGPLTERVESVLQTAAAEILRMVGDA